MSERESLIPDVHPGLRGKYFGLRRTRDESEVEGWYFVSTSATSGSDKECTTRGGSADG